MKVHFTVFKKWIKCLSTNFLSTYNSVTQFNVSTVSVGQNILLAKHDLENNEDESKSKNFGKITTFI